MGEDLHMDIGLALTNGTVDWRQVDGKDHEGLSICCVSLYHVESEHGFDTEGIGVDDAEKTKVDGCGGKLFRVCDLREGVQVATGIDDGDFGHKVR